MANSTNASAPDYSYEYYLDYLDLIPVDERKLRAHKHAIAITFWAGLVAFVLLLLLVLLYMSWSGSPPARNHTQHQSTCPWGLLPLRVLRHLLLHRAPQRTPQAPPSSTKELQQLQQEGPICSTPTTPQAVPAVLWERALCGDPTALADVRHKPSWPPPRDGTDAGKPQPLSGV